MTAEFKRLGRSGSYRLGRLRAQGVSDIRRPVPFKLRFARPDHRWPASVWLLSLVLGVLLIAAGAGADWWFMPFVAGVLAGAANWIGRWPTRAAVTAVVVMAALGWLLPWWWALLRGQPYGEDARIAAGLGVDADDDLAVEVLGDVGDEAVLADGHDDVARREQEPGQVVALDQPAVPVDGNGRGGRRDGGLHRVVAVLDVFDPAAPGLQEKRGLPPGAVPLQQFLQFGAAVNQDGPRRKRHDVAAPVPSDGGAVSLASSGVSRSGASTRVPICGSPPARSMAASASRLACDRSR